MLSTLLEDSIKEKALKAERTGECLSLRKKKNAVKYLITYDLCSYSLLHTEEHGRPKKVVTHFILKACLD